MPPNAHVALLPTRISRATAPLPRISSLSRVRSRGGGMASGQEGGHLRLAHPNLPSHPPPGKDPLMPDEDRVTDEDIRAMIAAASRSVFERRPSASRSVFERRPDTHPPRARFAVVLTLPEWRDFLSWYFESRHDGPDDP